MCNMAARASGMSRQTVTEVKGLMAPKMKGQLRKSLAQWQDENCYHTTKLIEKSKLLIHFSRHQPTLAVKVLDSVAKKCQKNIKYTVFSNL